MGINKTNGMRTTDRLFGFEFILATNILFINTKQSN